MYTPKFTAWRAQANTAKSAVGRISRIIWQRNFLQNRSILLTVIGIQLFGITKTVDKTYNDEGARQTKDDYASGQEPSSRYFVTW